MVRRFLLIMVLAFLTVILALAVGMAVYKFSEGYTQPVPGWPSPSTSNR